ncbi:T9SS type A sorting domain-containing protein [Pseudotamlana agarivorans]|uniref:T9SS type A sorting domain-containing protein n=1 Tax=Pseudotamlana agarivorans TaxID=481183 RepID=UPI0008332845|nr:T9SS type A sorting domain-containing protein [Tamlana agarivorans]
MNLKLLFTTFCLLVFNLCLNANNDKYRLILVDDPATTITVAFNQISGENPTVHYGTVDQGTNAAMYSFSKTVDHETTAKGMHNMFVNLSGLTPDTIYYFVVNDSEGVSQRFWFKTAPSDNSRLFFIAGGDSRNNRVPRQNANILVSKLKPHAVLFGGDMTDDDTNTEWQDWFDDWQLTTATDGRMIPIIPSRGNHEGANSIFELFNTPTSDSYYGLTWGNNLIRTYTLNSEISVLGDQLTWLENDLAASSQLTWKMAQYHKPMRPHTSGKSEGNNIYNAWAQLFYDEDVRLVVDCDSHTAKTTWPIKPSSEEGHDEGFVIDEKKGTVYTGEGCWGAPLRTNNDDKSWTRSSGAFNQFKLIFVDEQKIELRTIDINNGQEVTELSTANDNPFVLPDNLNVFTPDTGAVVVISNENEIDNPCPIVGTVCDDGTYATVSDEENGYCECEGLPTEKLEELTVPVAASSDDAEENQSGVVSLDSATLELIHDADDQVIGIRFDQVQIPKGSTLYRAYIQFQTEDAMAQDASNLVIHGELAEASATFTTASNNITSRSLTANSIAWNSIPLWDAVGETGINQRTPYVTSIVQEIVSQSGWVTGNAITFMFSGSGKRVAESFDGLAAPVLKLFYQEPCPAVGTPCDDGDDTTTIDLEDGNCNCVGIKEEDTVSFQVNSREDDAEQAETGVAMYIDSSDLELVYDSFADQFNQTVGIRFNNITVPQGAVILNANIQFTVDETGSDPTSLIITGEQTNHSIAFTETNSDIANRTKTSAFVNWLDVPAWENVNDAGEAQKTPNLNSIVQEIVDQPGWSPFNAMSFFITGTGKRTAEAFDGDQEDAPVLIIEYALVNNCPVIGTPCDDGDALTINDEEDGFCNCVGVPDDVKEDSLSVLSSSDDAEEFLSTGVVDVSSTDLEFIHDGEDQVVGVRFNNVQFPDGGTLHRAYIQFTTDEDDMDQDPTNLMIHGELAPASATFTSDLNNISSRALTSNAALWNTVSLWETVGEAGINQRTPYVTDIVHEIVSQQDWMPGNAVTFIFSGSGKRVAEAFDGSAAPILKLFYQTPCAPKGTLCDDGDDSTMFDIEDGNCNCVGISESGSLEYVVNNANNDAEEEVSTGEMDITSTDLELIAESGSTNQLVGIRFTDIHLPENTLITNAYIQFTVDDDNDDATSLIIKTELHPNSEAFAATNGNISSRTLGVSSVAWDNIPSWTTEEIGRSEESHRTPDLKALVQEVIDQSGWEILNAITFVISGSGEREAEAFDGTAAPRLVIEYTTASLSVNNDFVGQELVLYPNPVLDVLTIKASESINELQVFDISGKLVKNKIITGKALEYTLDLKTLQNGIYFLQVKAGDTKQMRKIIKK